MTLSEIIQDIHGLEAELAELERRYGLLSADFYHLYKAGELGQTREFITWVGYYEAKLDRMARYQELAPSCPRTGNQFRSTEPPYGD